MTASTHAIAQALGEIAFHQKLDVRQQQQVSQVVQPPAAVDCVVYPQTQAQLSAVVACAQRHQWRILPCGSATKLGWGGLAQEINLIISTERLNQLVEHAVGDLTVTVEAGMKFSVLQKRLAAAGQFLGLDPAYDTQATVGGIVATADAGSLRQRYGGVRDMCLGLSLVRADGEIVKAGGRVVKNVAGYDLMKLMSGSFGTLGIISQVTFRLYPLPEASKTVVLTGGGQAIAQAAATLLASSLTPTALDFLSRRVLTSLGMEDFSGLVARFQSLPQSIEQQTAQLHEIADTLGLQEKLLAESAEAHFWQQVQALLWQPTLRGDCTVVCKVGILPNQAAVYLSALEALAEQYGLLSTGLIHAGSGLGIVRLSGAMEAVKSAILTLRSRCEQADTSSNRTTTQQGFLTILEAPASLKQQLDVWGYSGNALALMRKIKQQFDPQNILSPGRFIGGI